MNKLTNASHILLFIGSLFFFMASLLFAVAAFRLAKEMRVARKHPIAIAEQK